MIQYKSLLCLILLCVLGMPWPVYAERPNIVVIIADDLGASDLGTYGHPVVKTPHLDALARSGVQFNNAFLTTSSCTASRASILTGMYPHSSGAPKLHDEVPADKVLVSQQLRAAGYYTAAIGKWHIGEQVTGQFDLVVDPPGDSGAEGWVEALRNRPQDKPFFFWLASRDPHIPYAALQPDGPYQPQDAILLPFYLDTPGARTNVAQYYTEISRLDAYVGQLLAALEAQRLLDNTYVVFLSDNGAPMPRAKTTLYDAGIKTPLIIAGPQVAKGKHSAALVSSVDLMPTLLALAGVVDTAGMQGRDFSALLQHPDKPHRDAIFAEQHDHGFPLNKRAVRTHEFLYIRNAASSKHSCLLEMQPMGKELIQAFRDKQLNELQSLCFRKVPAEELYDVKKDPLNTNSLAQDPAHEMIRKLMRQRLDAQAKATNDSSYF